MEANEEMKDESVKKTPLEDPEETAHFKQVVSAFFNYSVKILR